MTPVDPARQTNGLLFFEYKARGIHFHPQQGKGPMGRGRI